MAALIKDKAWLPKMPSNKIQHSISGTSAATYKLMEPHWNMFYSCRVLLWYFIHEKKCVLPTMNLSTAKAIFGKALCQLVKLRDLFQVYCIFHATAYLCSSYRVGQPPIPSLSARSLDSTRSLSLPWGTTARVINCFHSYKSSIVNKCRPILVQGLQRDFWNI